MNPIILMFVGALLWLVGELWGVWRNFQAHRHGDAAPVDTTSQLVWLAESKWGLFVRLPIAVFCLSLFAHLQWGTWLLP